MSTPSILPFLASALSRRDEQPNLDLAQRIVQENDAAAVAELIENLSNRSKDIRHDCIKTLSEIGAREPSLIAEYVERFLDLLDNKDNRLQWGGMTALSAIAQKKPAELFEALGKIIAVADKGTVVTRDHCMKIMAQLAQVEAYNEDVVPLMMEQVLASPVNQLPMYAEFTAPVIHAARVEEFTAAIRTRLVDLELEPKRKRLEKVLRNLQPKK